MVSGWSFGSSMVSLACITSMCSVQRFCGGHCLRLAFGSFFYRLILAFFFFFAVAVKPFSFYFVFGYAWILCNHCFFVIWGDNVGGTFVMVFACFFCFFFCHGFCVGVLSDTSWLDSSTTAWLQCFRGMTVVLHLLAKRLRSSRF